VGSGRVERRIAPGKGRIDSLMSSPDGKILYFVAGGSLWIIPADGGEARRIGTADSAAMDPSGHTMVLQRRENSRLRLFRLSLDGGQEQEIPMDGSVPLFSPFLSPGALDGKGRLLVSLNPTDSWFCPPGLVDIATGRITRIPASKLSDYEYPVWTADGHVMALQLGLQASIWKFRSAPKAVGRD